MGRDFTYNRFQYSYDIGKSRENTLHDILISFGFKVSEHKVFANGVDNVGYIHDVPAYAMEITNEYVFSYISTKRARSMIENFSAFPNVPHVVVTSFGVMTKEAEKLFHENNVYVITIGFQELPICYYNYFRSIDSNSILLRRRRCRQTIDIIRGLILRALKRLGIICPYMNNTLKYGDGVKYCIVNSQSLNQTNDVFRQKEGNWRTKTRLKPVSIQLMTILTSANPMKRSGANG